MYDKNVPLQIAEKTASFHSAAKWLSARNPFGEWFLALLSEILRFDSSKETIKHAKDHKPGRLVFEHEGK